jgi:hypothetical protein
MTTPVTAQGLAAQGMSTQQQGYAPGFPPPLGIEQYFGQQHFGQPQHWSSPQQYGGAMPSLFSGQQFPGQQHLGTQPHQVQQIVQALVSQLLPIAQQVILPQVVATATQQIPYQLQQLVISQLGQQAGWQQSPFGQFGQQAGWQQSPFGRPYQGSF